GTGGKPLLQLAEPLVDALHEARFEVALETNGTLEPPPGIDWICVSPKARADLILRSGDELKLVYPQEGAPPEQFAGLDFRYFSLQPMDGPDREIGRASCRERVQMGGGAESREEKERRPRTCRQAYV